MDFINATFDNKSSYFDDQYENLIDYEDCINGESMQSYFQFFKCLKYYLSKSILASCLVLGFSFCTFLLNVIVIIFITKLKHHKTVFDKIFIGHSIVDALVGILVIPNYCIYSVFGYWPLGKILCHFYVSLDYTICHVGIMHMVFIAYARLRSLRSPKQYHNEFLISNAKLTMFILWLISALLWLPAVNLIIDLTYKNNECYFNFDPRYILIQDSVAYLLPMSVILLITGYILKILHERNIRRTKLQKNRNKNKSKSLKNLNENFSTSELSINSDCSTLDGDKMQQFASSSKTDKTNFPIESLNETYFSSENVCESLVNKIVSTDQISSRKILNGSSNFSKQLIMKPNSGLRQTYNSNFSTNCEVSFISSKSLKDVDKESKTKKKQFSFSLKLNAYTKLYAIIATFCVLWLPFCILWPIFSVCQTCISKFVYQISYWMGYAQSLINPILLLILNPNYNKLKPDN